MRTGIFWIGGSDPAAKGTCVWETEGPIDGEPARLLPDHVSPSVQGVKRHWRQQVDGEEKKENFSHVRDERDDQS
ncbi:hypothetical protein MAR_037331 [Mya arenaria]|uniref:MHC class I antigen n=1 Tax=Mya arenaria TaxID=6604 RepID=A0ABY7FNF3_MYAAR|nr:hypothetical protein MAR_037331 [Mya arenaria]